MAKLTYLNVNGLVRKVKAIWIKVNNVWKTIKMAWVKNNNIWNECMTMFSEGFVLFKGSNILTFTENGTLVINKTLSYSINSSPSYTINFGMMLADDGIIFQSGVTNGKLTLTKYDNSFNVIWSKEVLQDNIGTYSSIYNFNNGEFYHSQNSQYGSYDSTAVHRFYSKKDCSLLRSYTATTSKVLGTPHYLNYKNELVFVKYENSRWNFVWVNPNDFSIVKTLIPPMNNTNYKDCKIFWEDDLAIYVCYEGNGKRIAKVSKDTATVLKSVAISDFGYESNAHVSPVKGGFVVKYGPDTDINTHRIVLYDYDLNVIVVNNMGGIQLNTPLLPTVDGKIIGIDIETSKIIVYIFERNLTFVKSEIATSISGYERFLPQAGEIINYPNRYK